MSALSEERKDHAHTRRMLDLVLADRDAERQRVRDLTKERNALRGELEAIQASTTGHSPPLTPP